MGKITVVSRNLIIVHGCMVDYDQTPREAMEGLPYNIPDVANYPQQLWNGGQTGIVERVDIPIYIPRRYFTTDEGRKVHAKIGYGCPADVAALKGEDIRKALLAEDLQALVDLRQSDEQLWRFAGYYRPADLHLTPSFLGFRLGYASYLWDYECGLVGVPQAPK